jgi:hypothetical protein
MTTHSLDTRGGDTNTAEPSTVSRGSSTAYTGEMPASEYVPFLLARSGLRSADRSNQNDSGLPPDYEENEADLPTGFHRPHDPPWYEEEETYNVSRAELKLQQECWMELGTAISALVRASSDFEHPPSDLAKVSRQLRLLPAVPTVEAAKETMWSAMTKADTVIGRQLFEALVLRRTTPGDVRLIVKQAHADVTSNLYLERWSAREAALRLHRAGLSQLDGPMDR